MPTPEMWIALIAMAGTIVTGVITYRTSRATTHVEQTKVDAAAYDRARLIYEGALTTLEEQLAGVRSQLNSVSAQLAQEQDTSAGLRRQIRDLRIQMAELEQTVSDLRIALSQAGISQKEPEGA